MLSCQVRRQPCYHACLLLLQRVRCCRSTRRPLTSGQWAASLRSYLAASRCSQEMTTSTSCESSQTCLVSSSCDGDRPSHGADIAFSGLFHAGTPSDEDLDFVKSERARAFMKKQAHKPKVPFSTIYPDANPEALDLLEKMLVFHPQKRITIQDALKHPYMASLHNEEDEPVADSPFNFSFENVAVTKEQLQRMIFEEVAYFHPEMIDEEAKRFVWWHVCLLPCFSMLMPADCGDAGSSRRLLPRSRNWKACSDYVVSHQTRSVLRTQPNMFVCLEFVPKFVQFGQEATQRRRKSVSSTGTLRI